MSPSEEGKKLVEDVLQFVENGEVVTVVGQDLLVLDLEETDPSSGAVRKRRVSLYAHLAEALAEELGVSTNDLSSGQELHDVAVRYYARQGSMEEVYQALARLMPPREAWSSEGDGGYCLPQPLLKLAEISPLKLFVTTTFDPLLAYALQEKRGPSGPLVLAYGEGDLPTGIQGLREPTVFHLFGRLSPYPEYPVTEEDVLEAVRDLQDRKLWPEHLFHALANRMVLILGCSFPNWLARFFIRAAKEEKLSKAGGHRLVADSVLRTDGNLLRFLTEFPGKTRVFMDGDAIDFVDLLHETWKEKAPGNSKEHGSSSSGSATWRADAVFLSYAREDGEAASNMADALRNARLDVFLDGAKIRPGDWWETRLELAIEECSVFVALLSKHSLDRGHRFFRKEWKLAFDKADKFPKTARFVFPVILDDTSIDEHDLFDFKKRFEVAVAPEGRPDAELLEAVVQASRNNQKRKRAS